ncbi:MAG: hypothetical protein KBA66_13215 [Leptospiraceae bacterium]|nr:hypothetical protein [Leptospiraceae bacterium]
MAYRTLLLFPFLLFSFCDLENRYPDAGEFCTPMRDIPECVKMDFRNRTLNLNQENFDLTMISRVQYEKITETQKLEIDVLSEHRIRIQTKKLPEMSLEKKEIYLRKKGPRISLWTKIKNWQAKK